jgi:hypothetical protein
VSLALILIGAFTKSAQFPFHFWLPHAMAAPTPVSAYLHSATMVKAGIFLLARLWPVFAGTELWFVLLSGVGLVTMLVAAWIALFRDDLKLLLAYSTVSQLGMIVMLLGFGTPAAAVAAVFHILNHALFKAALFMNAGIVGARHAAFRGDGFDCGCGDGGGAAVQRLPVQGNDARTGKCHGLWRHTVAAAAAGHGGCAVLGGLLGTLAVVGLLRQNALCGCAYAA